MTSPTSTGGETHNKASLYEEFTSVLYSPGRNKQPPYR